MKAANAIKTAGVASPVETDLERASGVHDRFVAPRRLIRAPPNRLEGPRRMGPLVEVVVAGRIMETELRFYSPWMGRGLGSSCWRRKSQGPRQAHLRAPTGRPSPFCPWRVRAPVRIGSGLSLVGMGQKSLLHGRRINWCSHPVGPRYRWWTDGLRNRAREAIGDELETEVGRIGLVR